MKKILLCILLSFLSATAFAAVKIKPPKGTVALTFDDGPHPIYTKKVLKVLRDNNIKATFFVVGMNAKKYPEMIKQIKAEGHVVASHSQTHPMLTKLSAKKLNYEIATPNIIVKKIIGIEPKCLRYPFGASNERVRAAIRAHGIQPVSMGFNSFDYTRPGAKKIASWVIKNLHNRQVILLHDGFNHRQQTVDALPAIIQAVRAKGLGFGVICG